MSDNAIFDAHCLALGRLCVAWAVIDRQLNDIMTAVLGCTPATTACIASTADTVAARCDILQRLIYEDPISADWAEQVDGLLKRVALELSPRRNRYTHDFWALTNGTLIRMDRRARSRRKQSRHPVQLEYDVLHATNPAEVATLTVLVGQTAFLLHCAQRDAEDWQRHRMHAIPPLLSRALDLPDLPDVLRHETERP